MSQDQVAFSRARKTVIDFVRPDGRTQICGKTLDDLRAEYPDVSIEEFEVAYKAIESCFIKPVHPVSAEQFIEALEVMPPLNWVRAEDSESFKSMEMTYGNVTRIWVRVGDHYFSLSDRRTLTHAQILERVVSYLERIVEEG